jgi:hypothetical protein
MLYIEDKILKLTRQLYPTGRAWKMPFGGWFETLHKSLIISEARAYNDATAILTSLLPDNPDFTVDDATDWERRLGLITNQLTPLALRKQAIARKMQAPGANPAKGHYLYLQSQLQLAGFPVYVFENINYLYPTGFSQNNPVSVSPNLFSLFQFGDKQFGDTQMGGGYTSLIVNSIDEQADNNFNIGNNLRSTFFIGGAPLGNYVTIPLSRKEEFRQLILNIKQVQTVGFLLVNYY